MYQSPRGSSSSQPAADAYYPPESEILSYTDRVGNTPIRSDTFRSKSSSASKQSKLSGQSKFSERPTLYPSESSSTLVGSSLDRKIRDVDPRSQAKFDTTERLDALRELMAKHELEYYIIPTEDAHGSEYVAINDKRREWISGFTGSSAVAIVSRSRAYMAVDSRYWIQAKRELDSNWSIIKQGSVDGPSDWIEWLEAQVKDCRVGIDARMLSYEKATRLNGLLQPKNAKLFYPPQNLVDLIWKEKPPRSREPVFVQPLKLAGTEAGAKIAKLRAWIKAQPPSVPSYSKGPPTATQIQEATLISNLSSIAWLLNLRGDDIPFNPVFHSYLFISSELAVLFIEDAKVTEEVQGYLASIGVSRRDYNDVWTFLRKKEWGQGRVIISPQTSYAISLMLTSYHYTVLPSVIEEWKAIKNDAEIAGMRAAYIRDGAAFVKWLAWLEYKIGQGYDITEYEAAWRLTEFRRKGKNYVGLAYENISASGKNAALPHYVPRKADEVMLSRDEPYLNDSGGQYLDGTCDTTRTIHFGRPTEEQCEAFTRVLQGHIAIDSAIFPEGTSGAQLDVLARKALWQDGLNYMHGTGHGFGSFLNVHEGPHGFSSSVSLQPGHVITNEPGFYKEKHWGIRIESALLVRRVTTKREFNGDIWLGFERLTCVPIQAKMVNDSMLTKEERKWLKDHNKRCLDILEPFLRDDKRALKWLQREAQRGIGMAKPVPGGVTIDWQ
ncbi:Creatinase/aminopeptidase [Trametopsis cervina]|nr:Creatinase/aminopeptidase [Trametopsis cervina]